VPPVCVGDLGIKCWRPRRTTGVMVVGCDEGWVMRECAMMGGAMRGGAMMGGVMGAGATLTPA